MGRQTKGQRVDRELRGRESVPPIGDQGEHGPEIEPFAVRGISAEAGFRHPGDIVAAGDKAKTAPDAPSFPRQEKFVNRAVAALKRRSFDSAANAPEPGAA